MLPKMCMVGFLLFGLLCPGLLGAQSGPGGVIVKDNAAGGASMPHSDKASLMIVAAHPDDEVYNFGGAITYYEVVRQLPVVLLCMTSEPAVREAELRCACLKYGMEHEPVFAGFSNCCYGGTVEDNWEKWGGRMNVVRYLTGQIRKYKPEVILGHDLKGEMRAHPNHICSALALIDAFKLAGDESKFPEQLTSVSVWQPKKLYLHFYAENSWDHYWTMTVPELGGKSVQEIAEEGIRCHVSQNAKKGCKEKDGFGLYLSRVGPDIIKENDFFENIDLKSDGEKR